jgi:hypothetical protein
MSCSSASHSVPRYPALEEFGCLGLIQLQTAGVVRIEILQFEVFAFGDAKRVDVFTDAVDDLFSRHGATSRSRRLSLAPATQLCVSKFCGPDRMFTALADGG